MYLRGPPRPGKPGGPPGGKAPAKIESAIALHDMNIRHDVRGGAPKAPGGPNPGTGPPIDPPPIPGEGPVKPTGKPLPAGRETPGPAASVATVEGPPAAPPNRAAGSAGGGPSTEREMTCAPRMIVKPIARRSSVSVIVWDAPGAAFPFRRVRLNSSVSARTRFICCEIVSNMFDCANVH